MRPIRTGIATMVVASLASLAYARVPSWEAAASPANPMTSFAAAYAVPQDQEKPDQTKPSTETPEAKPKADKSKPSKANRDQQKGDKDQMKGDKDQKADKDQAKNEQGGKGRIPDRDFKAHFGQSHSFTVKRVVTTTRIVPNQTRFVYSGYSFVFVDPWPAGWALDDDCYIDYIDGGYFLVDVVHPGARITLTIVG